MFVFKYPAGMTDEQVRAWFAPKILNAGDRSWANCTNEEIFFRDVYLFTVECSRLLQDFFDAANSAPLRDLGGSRIDGRRASCVSYFAWLYAEYTGQDPRDKLSYDKELQQYSSPFLSFMEIIFDIIEPDHRMSNHTLGHLIRSVLGPKQATHDTSAPP
jgi:hypothetical protein